MPGFGIKVSLLFFNSKSFLSYFFLFRKSFMLGNQSYAENPIIGNQSMPLSTVNCEACGAFEF